MKRAYWGYLLLGLFSFIVAALGILFGSIIAWNLLILLGVI